MLLTVFTIGVVLSISIYGFCIYRNGAPKRSGKGPHGDIEQGRYAGITSKASLRVWATYGKQLGQDISRKISATISRRPTAIVSTKKSESFTILPEEASSYVPQQVLQPSSESGAAAIVEPRSIVIGPIMPVRAMTPSRPTSSVTISTVRETGTGLSLPARPTPTSNSDDKGLRPAPFKANILAQVKPLPILPALQLDLHKAERPYGLPPAENRLKAMRPTSRTKSANAVESNHKRISSLPAIRRSASTGVVAALDSPPVHLTQVPISALPPATPTASSIYRYSRATVRPFYGPGATIEGPSGWRSNTVGPVVEVPFVMAFPPTPHFNQSTDTFGTGTPPTSRPLETRDVPKPLDILYSPARSDSPSRSDEDSFVDPFGDIPYNRPHS